MLIYVSNYSCRVCMKLPIVASALLSACLLVSLSSCLSSCLSACLPACPSACFSARLSALAFQPACQLTFSAHCLAREAYRIAVLPVPLLLLTSVTHTTLCHSLMVVLLQAPVSSMCTSTMRGNSPLWSSEQVSCCFISPQNRIAAI